MKFIVVSILFICTIAASFSNWLVIASFNINQGYIAKQLCVNRYKPNSNCNGHCYLGKQLNKTEKPEGNNGSTGKEKFEVQLFFMESPNSVFAIAGLKNAFQPCNKHFTQQLCIRAFFHPPSV